MSVTHKPAALWPIFRSPPLSNGTTETENGRNGPSGIILWFGASKPSPAGSTWPRADKFMLKEAFEPAAMMTNPGPSDMSPRLWRSAFSSSAAVEELGFHPKWIPLPRTRAVWAVNRQWMTIFLFDLPDFRSVPGAVSGQLALFVPIV